MKNYVAGIVILFVFFSFGCSGIQAVKQPQEQPLSLQAETTTAGDNQTSAQQNKEALQAGEAKKDLLSTQPQALPPLEARAADAAATIEKQLKEKGGGTTDNESGGKISLNFDNADIYEVINALSDFLGISYIIDPAVKGKVNIHTTGEIDKAQLLPIVETIFEMNNVAIVKFGDFYKIVPIKEAQKEIMDVNIGRTIEEPESYDKVIIQVVPLKYVPSPEVIKVLKPFTGKGGEVVDYPKSNIIILVETAANIQKLLRIIDIIDIDAFQQTNIRFFKVKNADVTDLAKELENIFSSFGIEKTTAKGIGLSVIPIDRASCVVAVSSIPGILDKVQHWVEVLDTVDKETDEQIFIYFVENGKAGEIADILIQLYGGDSRSGSKTASKETKTKATTSSSKSRSSRRSRTGETDRERAARTKTPEKTTGKTSSLLEGNIMIVTDESTNAIIVKTTPLDYANIKDTIRRLDIIPRQVLIEVMIAEVTLSGDTEFGIEWALLGSKASIGGYKGSDRAGVDLGLGGIGNTDITKSLGKGLTYAFD
ncbi:MAG: secretin N-terminal domain-containing protein, partial [Pseudomonadota bacterium]